MVRFVTRDPTESGGIQAHKTQDAIMKGMVIRMKAKKIAENSTTKKPRHTWGIALRTGLLGVVTASVLLLGVSCTRNGGEDGTVADSNVGSVTSDVTDKDTSKNTEAQSDMGSEKDTEARTNAASEQSSGTATMPGTTPGTGEAGSSGMTEQQTSPMTTTPGTTTPGTTVPGTTAPGNAKSRVGKG